MLYREDYGADALSLMEQLSQHTAAAFMEAEQILSSCDGKAKESVQSLLNKPAAANEKENMIAVDRQMVDGSVCSPSSLLVCLTT